MEVATNLTDLRDELMGPTAQQDSYINKWEFNLVLGVSGATGATYTETKLQAISKAFTSPEQVEIFYSNNVIGNQFGRSLIKNPTWNQIRILKYSQELPLLTVVNFCADNSALKGKTGYKRTLVKEGDQDFTDVVYENQYFSYMFHEKGGYTLSLEVTDSNGNKKVVTKRELIKII